MPHSYTTNVDEVNAWTVGLFDTFGFTSTYEGKALGNVLAETTAEGIRERSIERQCDGSGTPWPVNSDGDGSLSSRNATSVHGQGYRSRKRRLYGTDLTNVRTGQMLSIQSLMAKVVVTQYLVEIHYGTGEPPTSSSTGYIEDADKRISDDDKAFYAHEQGRKFFELDADICDANFAAFSKALGAHMANPGR
jgi:hypothetical protein